MNTNVEIKPEECLRDLGVIMTLFKEHFKEHHQLRVPNLKIL